MTKKDQKRRKTIRNVEKDTERKEEERAVRVREIRGRKETETRGKGSQSEESDVKVRESWAERGRGSQSEKSKTNHPFHVESISELHLPVRYSTG